jgi:hypothetical protein
MPQRNSVTGALVRAMRRRRARWDEWNEGERERAEPATAKRSRRLGAATFFATSFVLGAALSAGAGNTVATLAEETATTPATDAIAAADALATGAPEEVIPAAVTPPETPSEDAASATVTPPPAAHPAHPLAEAEVASELSPASSAAGAQAPAAPVDGGAVAQPASAPAPAEAPKLRPSAQQISKPTRQSKRKGTSKRRASTRPRANALLSPRARPRRLGSELEPEASLAGVDSTVWLHRSLPDPTPPSKRLSRAFADSLRHTARNSRVDWALMLGVLRAQGRTGAAPATADELDVLASRLRAVRARGARGAALGVLADSERADRAVALAYYHRAVGLPALVRGLEWANSRLAASLLRDDRVGTYEGGRFDIESGLVDVRVLVLIAYLAEAYGEVTVSSLKTGHRLYSRPGVVSAHVYGLAVDISSLGGRAIAGNQEPGGLTEDAVRSILLLPSELVPRQVISLLGLGGPSFPMGDHGDHIHVGY